MADILRVSLLGEMPNGEEWSVNPVWGLGDFSVSTTPAQVQAVATAIAAASVPAALITGWAPGTRHTGVRVEARTYAGVLENQAEAVRASPVNGSSSTIHPYQTSWVTSLRTAAVGASGRGRLYWPATGVVLDSDTYRPTTIATVAVLGGVKTYLGSVETAVKATFATSKLVVWSRKLNSAANVTSLQMGDILDTQRRRRDALIEAYSSTSFP